MATIAGSSATMVAIIGGLLVARFVAIASGQDGAKNLVDEAEARLSAARRRTQDARQRLYRWDIIDFFGRKVIQAIGDGNHDIGALRRVGDPTPLSDDELAKEVQTIADEFAVAETTLRELLANVSGTEDFVEWEDFQLAHRTSVPNITWDQVWDVKYLDLVNPPPPPPQEIEVPNLGWTSSFAPKLYLPRIPDLGPAPEYVVHNWQRRSQLQENLARTEQRVEDLEDELDRLTLQRDAIVRPKGLAWGLVVLGVFTLTGVIIPIWLMSRGPSHLKAHLGEVVFGLFIAGLLVLLGYMWWWVLRLSGWRQKAGEPRAVEGETSAESTRP